MPLALFDNSAIIRWITAQKARLIHLAKFVGMRQAWDDTSAASTNYLILTATTIPA